MLTDDQDDNSSVFLNTRWKSVIDRSMIEDNVQSP